MPPVPVLRVVPLDRILRHEEIDPFRVGRLVDRMAGDATQVNPMVCTETPNGELVLLDGATRTEALKQLGLKHAVVQIVQRPDVTLETWHHIVRDCPPHRILEEIEAQPDLRLADEAGTPRIHVVDGGYASVLGGSLSANATLSALVDSYIGKWTVSRMIDPTMESVSWRFPDWSVTVEFPKLAIDDVIETAVTEDLLPPGITRFLVEDRALRLNIDLSLLRSEETLEAKQQALDGLLAQRAHEGRIRRYQETVCILDD